MCSYKQGERTQSWLGDGNGGRRAPAWFSLVFSPESKLSGVTVLGNYTHMSH